MQLFKNIIYDFKAIRKYGIIKHLKYIFDYKHTIVILQTHLNYVPDYKAKPNYDVREVDYYNDDIMQQWCDIVNDAFKFKTPYNINTARSYLFSHPYKQMETLFFIYAKDEDLPVGTYFIGKLRNNLKIGTAGRIAIIDSHQRKGLGLLLVLYGYKVLRERSIFLTEEVFNLEKDYSIKLFLKCGSLPQFEYKYQQFKPTRKNILVTLYARYKVKQMYKKHLESIRKDFIS